MSFFGGLLLRRGFDEGSAAANPIRIEFFEIRKIGGSYFFRQPRVVFFLRLHKSGWKLAAHKLTPLIQDLMRKRQT